MGLIRGRGGVASSTWNGCGPILSDSWSDAGGQEGAAGGEPVVVGLVLGAHGTDGSLRVKSLSDVPQRFEAGRELFLRGRPYRVVRSVLRPPEQVILKLDGVRTRAAARLLAGEEVTVAETSAPVLPEGEYYHFQLLGLRVVTEEGAELGRIREVIVTGSNDVYAVAGPEGEILLPAVRQVVLGVDLELGVMRARLMGGMG